MHFLKLVTIITFTLATLCTSEPVPITVAADDEEIASLLENAQ